MDKAIDNYERLLLEIIINAGEKLIDAATLHNTGYSYRSSWYLAIIAEEEMAKLVIIPFSKLAGTLNELAKKPSIAYKHPIKQKIFTTYGVQNRSYKEIEMLKQNYLYVVPDANNPVLMPVVTSEQSQEEILHAVLLFDRLAYLNFSMSKSLSEEFKSLLTTYYSEIFAPAIKGLNPIVAASLSAKYSEFSKTTYELIQIIKTHPQLFAEMIQYALPKEYPAYFREIEGKSFHAAVASLKKYNVE